MWKMDKSQAGSTRQTLLRERASAARAGSGFDQAEDSNSEQLAPGLRFQWHDGDAEWFFRPTVSASRFFESLDPPTGAKCALPGCSLDQQA
jgi:hypothetical protein